MTVQLPGEPNRPFAIMIRCVGPWRALLPLLTLTLSLLALLGEPVLLPCEPAALAAAALGLGLLLV